MCDVQECNAPPKYIVKLEFDGKQVILFKICEEKYLKLKNSDYYELTPIKLLTNTMRDKIR